MKSTFYFEPNGCQLHDIFQMTIASATPKQKTHRVATVGFHFSKSQTV
jgi:hypothetical protein